MSRDSMPRSKYFRSMSRYGRMSVSRIFCQIMRVISSPSISTTGFFTLILVIQSPEIESATKYKQISKDAKHTKNYNFFFVTFMFFVVEIFVPFVAEAELGF